MELLNRIPKYLSQFKKGLLKLHDTPDYIYKNQLWNGMDRYGWLSKILIVIAVVYGLVFLNIFIDWWGKSDATDVYAATQSIGLLASDVFERILKPLYSTGSNYVILALVEVLVFHFSRRALEELTGKEGNTAFKDFFNAQKRMIKVMLFASVMTLVAKIILEIVFGIFGFLSFLQPSFLLVVEFYFLGFAILDNYNEQFGLTIKESFHYTRDFIGVALALGIVVYLLLLVPVIGPVAAPIIAAVAAALVMYELSDLHKKPRVDPKDLVVD